jgi:transglutaminase-like putative cysteine protease
MLQVIEAQVADLDVKLAYIRDFLRQGCRDPECRTLAANILREAGPYQVSARDPWSVATALYRWVQRNVPFERDPLTGEVLDLGGMRVKGPLDLIQNPAATLARGRGDCVALTILLGGLVCAAGLPIQIGLQDMAGGGIDHLFLLMGLPTVAPQEWLPLDLTADGPGVYRPGGQASMVAA